MRTAYIKSPIGFVEITGSSTGLATLYFRDKKGQTDEKLPPAMKKAVKQLEEYFAGKRKEFDLKLAPEGTDFQQRVWAELLTIPFGEKRSYLDIAIALGDRNATRAVGSANGQNPISVIVPCHRVIGSNGKLTGYGGGIHRKEWLLDFEAPYKQGELFV